MSVVERIEKYTSRERERLDKDDSPIMNHLWENGARVAMCGYKSSPGNWPQWPAKGNAHLLDCVVCGDLARAKGYL